MLISKYIVWTLVLLALFFIELSFLPRLLPWEASADFIFLLVFLSCFLDAKKDYFSYFLATAAGLFLDIYSGHLFFGLGILFFICLAWLIKKMGFLMQGLNVFSFLVSFFVAYFFYKAFSLLWTWPNFAWLNLLIASVSTLAAGIIYFFVYAFLYQKKS